MVLSLFTVVLAVGAAAVPALAASVSGRITAGASVEPAPALDVTIDAWTCGKDGKIADPRLVIGPERGLADVVLRLRGEGDAPAWTAPAEAPVMDQKGCVFTPHVVVVGPEQALKVGNSDPTLHNFHTRASENKTINRAQPRGMSFETKFAKPEIQKVVCDVHYWMSAVVVVTDTAWTAVSDENGRFAIADVADGTYDVELWHEELGERAGTVTVGGGDAVFDFTWERTAEESAAGASVAPIAVASCGCRGAMAGAGEDGMACGGGGCGHGMGAEFISLAPSGTARLRAKVPAVAAVARMAKLPVRVAALAAVVRTAWAPATVPVVAVLAVQWLAPGPGRPPVVAVAAQRPLLLRWPPSWKPECRRHRQRPLLRHRARAAAVAGSAERGA